MDFHAHVPTHRRRRIAGLTLLFLCLFCAAGAAQQPEPDNTFRSDVYPEPLQLRWRFELFAGLGLYLHSGSPFGADAPNLPPGAPAFEPTFGSMPMIAAAVSPIEIHFSPDLSLSAGVEAAFGNYGTQFSSIETTSLIVQGVPTEGQNEHLVDLSMQALTLTAWLDLRAGNWHLRSGPQLLLATGHQYDQTETILAPDGAEFPEGGDSRVIDDDNHNLDLDETILGLDVALAYDVFLDEQRSLSISPEIHFQPRSFSLNGEIDWQVRVAHAGFRVAWSPAAPTPPTVLRDTLLLRDTTTRIAANLAAEVLELQNRTEIIERDTLSPLRIHERTVVSETWLRRIPAPAEHMVVALEAEFVGADGSVGASLALDMDQARERVIVPIAPLWHATDFPRERHLPNMEVLRELARPDRDLSVIDTIGRRMRELPDAGLTVGGADESVAAALRNYLSSAWSVDSARVVFERSPADANTSVRARLSTGNPALLAPIELLRDVPRVRRPIAVRFTPFVFTENEIPRWRLYAHHALDTALTIFDIDGGGGPRDYIWEIPTELMPAILSWDDAVVTRFAVYPDRAAQVQAEPVYIRFRQITTSNYTSGTQVRIGLDLQAGALERQIESHAELLREAALVGVIYPGAWTSDEKEKQSRLRRITAALKQYSNAAVQVSPGRMAREAQAGGSQLVTGGTAEHVNTVWLVIQPGER